MSEPISHDHVAFLARYAHTDTRLSSSAVQSLNLSGERLQPLVDAGLVEVHPTRGGRCSFSVTEDGSSVAEALLKKLKELMEESQ